MPLEPPCRILTATGRCRLRWIAQEYPTRAAAAQQFTEFVGWKLGVEIVDVGRFGHAAEAAEGRVVHRAQMLDRRRNKATRTKASGARQLRKLEARSRGRCPRKCEVHWSCGDGCGPGNCESEKP